VSTPARKLRGFGLGGITGGPVAFYAALAVLVAMLPVPALNNGYLENVFRTILMYAAMSLAWNLIGGYAGYVSFGNVVFFGIGAYCSALLSARGIYALPICIPVAAIACAVFAVVVGLPVLRLRGHYFGIATLGVSLAVGEIIANVDVFGSSTGLSLRQVGNFHDYYYAMWAVCVACLLLTYIIARSKFGYALVAIRENEDAALVLGINPTFFKVAAWAVSGAMCGSAGAVFAFANAFIDPATAFSLDNNVFPIVMTILGGSGTVAGPLFGALVLTGINQTLWNQFPKVHTLFFGAVIVLVVMFLPRGLLALARLRGGARVFVADLRAYRV
jgi:branched-chain amino acid transport system permease protein